MAGLYIHIPFCAQFCAYCDFYSVRSRERMGEFLQALTNEMVLRHDYIQPPVTLYIGGGTPSLCGAKELGEVIESAKKLWNCKLDEVTVELNPEDVTPDYCRALADEGVNRLSIGIQSFVDEHLRFMHRRHNAKQGVKAVEAARGAGFDNISIDLIFGFPGLLEAQWRGQIRQALALAPEHLSAYALGIEAGTPLYHAVQQGRIKPVDDDVAAAQYALLQELLPASGLWQYEVSNFARKGRRSRHNSAYWQGVPYLGLGPSAHSFNGAARHANVRHLGRYIKGIQEERPVVKEERIGLRKRYNELVMTRLRTSEGLDRADVEKMFSDPKIKRHFEHSAALLLQQGLLVAQEGALKILPQKWFVSDIIVRELVI